jgi:hypothetical protein
MTSGLNFRTTRNACQAPTGNRANRSTGVCHDKYRRNFPVWIAL